MRKVLTSARRHWRLRSATAVAAVGALLASAGIVMLIAPTAGADTTTDPPDDKKVVVCKYTQTPPGVPDHIIVVSVNAIKDFPATPAFPWTFADAQDSVAIRFAVGNEQPGDEELANCPERRAARTPAGITISDPCDPGNVSWVAKADEFFAYSQTGSTVSATLLNPTLYYATGTTSWSVIDSGVLCVQPPPPPPPADLEELAPAVNFTDPTCEDLDGAGWDGTLEAFLDYEATGDVGVGETITVEATIETGLTDDYEFADGAQTEFSHTFADITLEDCVAGEETVVPKPKPEKPKPAVEPDKESTVAGVEVVVPTAAAPTAVAAGIAGGSAPTTGQLLGQGLVGIGLAMLVAAGWMGSPRHMRGAHEG